ncbi:sulfatase family protein [Phocaeicola plebeius]
MESIMKGWKLGLLVGSFGLTSNAFAQQRPNILWLTYEDTSPQFIGCYGNKEAKTPVMDGLAAEGVRFTNSYSTGTVSSPSRFCLITGCRPGRYGTGNHRSDYEIPEFVHGFPEYLREAGYYTSNNSKTDYNHKNHKEMTSRSWNESSNKASWRGRKPGQPFFSVFNVFHSHQSRTMTNPWDYYERQILAHLDVGKQIAETAPFEMPAFYRDSPEMRKHVSRVYNAISLTDQAFGEILADLEKDGLRDSTIIFCFSDHGEGIPRGKGSASGMGYQVPFILWIPEMYKHLTPWGSGVVTDELVSFEDFAATVLSLAGVELPSYMEGVPFLPAIQEKSKKYVFGACDAVDNNAELSRSVMDGRYMYTRVFTAYQPFVRWIPYYDVSDIQHQMRLDYRTGKMNACQKEIMEPRAAEYLYDLKKDKWETNNLAFDPAYKSIVEEMRSALKEHLIQTRDANFIPEYTLASECVKELPYYYRLSDKKYPIEEIVNVAMLSGMSEEVIPQQIAALQADNKFVSYWASVGLFTQRQHLRPYISQLEKILPTVAYPPAQIWLAGSILENEDSRVARKLFDEYLVGENRFLTIYALNVLLEMNMDMANTFVPQLREIEKKYGNNQKRPGVEDMMRIARLRLEGKDFQFDTYW